jgi:hypothetical protein
MMNDETRPTLNCCLLVCGNSNISSERRVKSLALSHTKLGRKTDISSKTNNGSVYILQLENWFKIIKYGVFILLFLFVMLVCTVVLAFHVDKMH